MRVLNQLPVPRDNNAQFPFSTIINQTDTVLGTPVVREVYGDILTNLYKVLQTTGVIPTGTEDSDNTQYQLLEALQRLPNIINDIEQVISLSGNVWTAPFNLTPLPNRYVFFARPSDNFVSGTNYTFRGSNPTPSLPFTSPTGFNASDELIIIIDNSGVRALSLRALASMAGDTVSTSFSTPLPYNSGNVMRYMSDGCLLSDAPSVVDLQTQIRTASGDGLATIYDTFVLSGHVLCFVFLPGTTTYVFYQFDLTDLNTAEAVPVSGITIPVGSDNQPYAYTDGTFVFVTNRAGNVADDFVMTRFSYTPATPTLTLVSNFTISNTFTKTSNVVVRDNQFLFTFIDGVLNRFDLGAATVTALGNFKSINGQIFGFNSSYYFSDGTIGTRWTI